MTTLNLSSFDAALKEHYTPQQIRKLSYQDRPLLALLPKYTRFGGKVLPIPIAYGNPNMRSRTAANVFGTTTGAVPGQVEDFRLTRARDYASVAISNEVLEASMGDANAFMEARTFEIDGMLNKLSNNLAMSLFGDTNGWVAQTTTAAGPATTFTLNDLDATSRFEVGDQLIFSINPDGSGPLDTVPRRITAINRDTGLVTIHSTITFAATTYFIFFFGDATASLAGLAAWLPATAPTPTPFFGVDRSVDTVRLGGVRFDGSAMSIEEALILCGARVVREGGRPTHVIMNPGDVARLVAFLGSRVVYDKAASPEDASIAFDTIRLMLPTGVVQVVADRYCPPRRAYMLQLDTWKLYSLGQAPRVWDADGQRMLRMSTADGVEVRGVYYAQLGCNAPGWNATISLAA